MAKINPYYPIVELTQEQYDALEVKDANTLYAIPYGGSPPRPGKATGFISGTVTPTLTGRIMYSGDVVSGTASIEEG